MIPKTPLEDWVAARVLGVAAEHRVLTREHIEAYQLARLRETLAYVFHQSPFYRRHLAGYSPNALADLKDFTRFPCTTADDLEHYGPRFLCVSQSEIERVVTLLVPGSGASPRRVWFTEYDLDRTMDFFRHGMATLVGPGDTVLILLPGERPGSVGDLLAKALKGIDVEGIVHGIVVDTARALDEIVRRGVDCVVGIPTQVLALARHPKGRAAGRERIKSVLLTTDYVPAAVVKAVGRAWGCDVFNHYGSTEMGLGGGVECRALAGYHLRETDLYFEIVDPGTGQPQPDGTPGEIVFTTLTRQGMPLIRYRTGDVAAFVTEPCPCATVLRRMSRVRGKLGDMVAVGGTGVVSTCDLDDAVFALDGLLDYRAIVTEEGGRDRLDIQVRACAEYKRALVDQVREAVSGVKAIKDALADNRLVIGSISLTDELWLSTGVSTRGIIDQRNHDARPKSGHKDQ